MLKVRFLKILMFPAETRGELFGSLKAQRVNGNAEKIDWKAIQGCDSIKCRLKQNSRSGKPFKQPSLIVSFQKSKMSSS